LLSPRTTIVCGDIVIAIPSVSAHTNGYTLLNALYRKQTTNPALSREFFLRMSRPHRCYLNVIQKVLADIGPVIKGLAHITGGGLIDNPPRILPDGLDFVFSREAIDGHMSEDFKSLWRESGISTHEEMYQTFNSGIGMIVVVEQRFRDVLQAIDKSFLLGVVTTAQGGPRVKFC